jgi:hypothetical protein
LYGSDSLDTAFSLLPDSTTLNVGSGAGFGFTAPRFDCLEGRIGCRLSLLPDSTTLRVESGAGFGYHSETFRSS